MERATKRSRLSEEIWAGLAVTLFGILFVVCLPAIIPALAVSQWRDDRRLRAAARVFACLDCGAVIGDKAIRLAEAAWSQHRACMHAENSGVLFKHSRRRIVRRLHAICPRCGARYRFAGRESIFVAIGRNEW